MSELTLYITCIFKASVYFEGVEDLCSEVKKGDFSRKKTRNLKAGESVSVSWPLVPLRVYESYIYIGQLQEAATYRIKDMFDKLLINNC